MTGTIFKLHFEPPIVGGRGEKSLPCIYVPPGVSYDYLLNPYRELQYRFGDNPLNFLAVCPQNGTAVLKGLRRATLIRGRDKRRAERRVNGKGRRKEGMVR